MNDVEPLQTLADASQGQPVPLPEELRALYGPLRMPVHAGRPHVISAYVSTIDGVVSLGPAATMAPAALDAGISPGEIISGASRADKMVLALLHAIADVLLVGHTGIRGNPRDVRRAERIYPPLADAFRMLRAELGKPAELPVAVLSPDDDLDPSMPVFQVPGVRMAILTKEDIVPLLVERDFPPNVEVVALPLRSDGTFSAAAVLGAVERFQHAELVLCNAGPRFMAHMIAERCLDEFFLTVAPQVAGRDGSSDRPGFVDGKVFAPTEPRGAELVSVKRASNHLFLRYALQVQEP
jgi:riboflavin biosynthesis pyrimidine reductase